MMTTHAEHSTRFTDRTFVVILLLYAVSLVARIVLAAFDPSLFIVLYSRMAWLSSLPALMGGISFSVWAYVGRRVTRGAAAVVVILDGVMLLVEARRPGTVTASLSLASLVVTFGIMCLILMLSLGIEWARAKDEHTETVP
jgi:hypothetical protein